MLGVILFLVEIKKGMVPLDLIFFEISINKKQINKEEPL